MAQTKLAILIVLSNGIDVPLLADKETEIVAAADPFDTDRVTEGHKNRVTHFLALHGKRPSKGFSSLSRNKI